MTRKRWIVTGVIIATFVIVIGLVALSLFSPSIPYQDSTTIRGTFVTKGPCQSCVTLSTTHGDIHVRTTDTTRYDSHWDYRVGSTYTVYAIRDADTDGVYTALEINRGNGRY